MENKSFDGIKKLNTEEINKSRKIVLDYIGERANKKNFNRELPKKIDRGVVDERIKDKTAAKENTNKFISSKLEQGKPQKPRKNLKKHAIKSPNSKGRRWNTTIQSWRKR